jgi:hypothetical protein
MRRSGHVHERCAAGRPCVEVVARLVAADKADRLGDKPAADKLRATAKKHAAVHGYGSDDELREAS